MRKMQIFYCIVCETSFLSPLALCPHQLLLNVFFGCPSPAYCRGMELCGLKEGPGWSGKDLGDSVNCAARFFSVVL